jgi:glutathione S-transferase
MMILRSSPASPFGRKVKMALSVLGMLDRVDVVNADTTSPSDSIRAQNPLGKIPALILEDGTAVYDSRVIVDCLDGLDGRGILVPPGQRLLVLRQQALADGLMDAAILQMYEKRFRPARAPCAKLARPPARQGRAGTGVCRSIAERAWHRCPAHW